MIHEYGEPWRNDTDRGNWGTRGNPCLSAGSSTTNATCWLYVLLILGFDSLYVLTVDNIQLYSWLQTYWRLNVESIFVYPTDCILYLWRTSPNKTEVVSRSSRGSKRVWLLFLPAFLCMFTWRSGRNRQKADSVLPISLLKRTLVSLSLCCYLTRKRSKCVTSQELKKEAACVRSNDIVMYDKTGCPKSLQPFGHTCSLKRASLQTRVNMSCHVVNVRGSRKLAT